MRKLRKEFLEFLKEYKIVGLAIGFIMGAASTSLVKSLVDNIIMPLITPFIPGGAWKTATIGIGPVVLGVGAFIGELLYFLILAFVVFLVAKYLFKERIAAKK